MSAPTVPSPDLGLTWRPISLDDIDVWLELMGPHSPARRCGGSSSGAGCIPSGAGVAWRIAVNFEERLPDRAALCAVAGYTAIRWFHDKSRPLGPSAPPVPEVAVPAGLQPPWTDDLDDAVRLTHNEAFAKHWGSQTRDAEAWAMWTIGHRSFRRDWSRVILDPTRPDAAGRAPVAGYLVAHAYPQDWEALGHSQGRVDLIGVRPAWRGRGLAPALLAEAFRTFAADGMEAAGLDADTGNETGSLRLHEGLGFAVYRTSVTWTIDG